MGGSKTHPFRPPHTITHTTHARASARARRISAQQFEPGTSESSEASRPRGRGIEPSAQRPKRQRPTIRRGAVAKRPWTARMHPDPGEAPPAASSLPSQGSEGPLRNGATAPQMSAPPSRPVPRIRPSVSQTPTQNTRPRPRPCPLGAHAPRLHSRLQRFGRLRHRVRRRRLRLPLHAHNLPATSARAIGGVREGRRGAHAAPRSHQSSESSQ